MNIILKITLPVCICLSLLVSTAFAKDKTTTVDGIDATIKTQKTTRSLS